MAMSSHYVATGYVYDRRRDSFLLVWQKKLGKWISPGGHLHAGEMPHAGCLREVAEEIGVEGRIVNLLETPNVDSETAAQLSTPFCILYERIPAEPGGEEHMHIDFVYVLEIDTADRLKLGEQEVSLARWFAAKDIEQLDTYENVRRVCKVISTLSRGEKTWLRASDLSTDFSL